MRRPLLTIAAQSAGAIAIALATPLVGRALGAAVTSIFAATTFGF